MYEPSEIYTRTISIDKYAQTLEVAPLPDALYANAGVLELEANATSGLPVHYQVISGPAMSENGGVLLTGPGKVALAVSQEGNWRYWPVEPQTIQFEARATWRRSFDEWTAELGLAGSEAEPEADPDKDGVPLLANYLFAGNLEAGIPVVPPEVSITRRYYTTEVAFRYIEGGPRLLLERAIGSPEGPWSIVKEIKDPGPVGEDGLHRFKIFLQQSEDPVYLRLRADY